MQQKSGDFSIQDAMNLASTPAGQQLLALLQQLDPSVIDKVKQQVAQGDYSQIKKLLAPLLASQEAQQILRKLGGDQRG